MLFGSKIEIIRCLLKMCGIKFEIPGDWDIYIPHVDCGKVKNESDYIQNDADVYEPSEGVLRIGEDSTGKLYFEFVEKF